MLVSVVLRNIFMFLQVQELNFVFCGEGSIHHTCTSSSMLDTNVDLHFAGVKMHLAKVFIVPKKHRTMGIYIVTTLGGTGAVG